MKTGNRAAARPKSNSVRRTHFAPGVSVPIFFVLACVLAYHLAYHPARAAQRELTPQQQEIKVLTARLSSADVEERREAVTRLGALGRPEGSRAAAAALGDAAPVVRATAARAVLSLP